MGAGKKAPKNRGTRPLRQQETCRRQTWLLAVPAFRANAQRGCRTTGDYLWFPPGVRPLHLSGSFSMPALRIAQLMASGPVTGGLEKHFVDLCGGLAAEHRVMAIADPTHATGLPTEVEFCPFNFSGSRRSPLTLLQIHRLLKAFDPDVIHAQANKAAEIVNTLRYFSGAKRVATVHNIKHHPRVFRKFDAVICVSSAIKEQLRLLGARVVLNGIARAEPPVADPHYFQQQLGLVTPRRICLAVGRLAKAKGFDHLIRAWRGVDAHLVIAGDGPERSELEALIKRLKLEQTVHLAGFRRDVRHLMASAAMVVISSDREGFPYVMVEALHLKKVIVSTRFPGASDLLPEAFLVPRGQEDELRQCVERTLESLEQSHAQYQTTWDYARTHLTVDHMVHQTSQVYSEVLRLAAA